MVVYIHNEIGAWTAGPEGTVLMLNGEQEQRSLLETNAELTGPDGAEKYEVLDGVGSLTGDSFAVINNIPVTEDGREAFEERFRNRARMVESEPGFVAIRVLRPLNGDTYRILTLWGSEADFKAWQSSKAYEHAHKKRQTSQGIDQQQPSIFPRPSFVTTYRVSVSVN
ncbi:antibiotic biosynthesis monooxygenase family protein [Paenibacillus turpanensis]|uniref:antibiotic biosynthesis monooxygenase family protein n=1 Tax=Paenibacillus turpanensis TaxID=2689078 RepID=UPI0014083255|nr:antibiotic biosynthesis monooxygenase [Paenibacillus turpanensis]